MAHLITPEEARQIAERPMVRPEGIAEEYFDDPDCGLLLRVYLGLTAGSDLSEEDRLYNRYYWFSRFANAVQEKFGLDEGLEQQLYQILETAEVEVDWDLIEELHHASEGEG